ncbi:unnamed protein product [Ixodes persulcatus]
MTKIIRDYNKVNFASINDTLFLFYEFYVDGFHTRTVEENWRIYKTKLSQLTDTFFPLVHIRSNSNQPWFNKTLKSLGNKKKRPFRLAKNCNAPMAWVKYAQCESEYNSSIALAKQKCFGWNLPSVLTNNSQKIGK